MSTRKNPWALVSFDLSFLVFFPSLNSLFLPFFQPSSANSTEEETPLNLPTQQLDDSVSLGSLISSLTSSARHRPPRPSFQPLQHLSSSSDQPPPPPSLRYFPIAERLIDSTPSLEEAVGISNRALRMTEADSDPSTRGRRLRQIYDLLLDKLSTFPQLPNPTPLCSFVLDHQEGFHSSTWFNSNPHPLTILLERYQRIFVERRGILDPVDSNPGPEVLTELQQMRWDFVAAVKTIREAMVEVGGEGRKGAMNVRSQVSVLSAYGQGLAYEELDQLWEELTKEGGVGVDGRALAVVSLSRVASSSVRLSLELIFVLFRSTVLRRLWI